MFPVEPVVLPPVLSIARDPRVQSAPGFPCALCSRRRVELTQTSGDMRREIAKHALALFDI